MNPRFEAFMQVNAYNMWRRNSERNAAFIAFISYMKSQYVKEKKLDINHVGGAYISDHKDFTQFILNTVKNDNHRR